MNTIGNNIKTVRENLNLTQKAFASRVGIHHNYLSLVENGRKNISDKNIAIICHVFNINEDWLRFGTGNMYLSDDTKISSLESSYTKAIGVSSNNKQQDLELERLRSAIVSAIVSANTEELKALQSLFNKIGAYNIN